MLWGGYAPIPPVPISNNFQQLLREIESLSRTRPLDNRIGSVPIHVCAGWVSRCQHPGMNRLHGHVTQSPHLRKASATDRAHHPIARQERGENCQRIAVVVRAQGRTGFAKPVSCSGQFVPTRRRVKCSAAQPPYGKRRHPAKGRPMASVVRWCFTLAQIFVQGVSEGYKVGGNHEYGGAVVLRPYFGNHLHSSQLQ